MSNKLLCKCLLKFGLLLFFTSLITFAGLNSTPVKASSDIGVEKEDDYRLNLNSITLVKGKSYTLKVYNLNDSKVTYKSDDEEIASVSEIGEITANTVGTVNVTATVKSGTTKKDLTCVVTVGLPAFSVKLTKSRIIIGLDKTDFLNVILKPSNTVEAARFSSNDSSIVSVSTGGRITAKKFGLTYVFAEIEAMNFDGSRKFSRCTVIVIRPEDVPLLEAYLSETSKFDNISEEDLNKAIDEFINSKYDATSSTSFISSLDSYLVDKLNLDDPDKSKEADLDKIPSNPLEAIFGK